MLLYSFTVDGIAHTVLLNHEATVVDVLGRSNDIGATGSHIADASGYQVAGLQLDAIVHDAVLAARTANLECKEVGTDLQCSIDKVAGVDIVATAIDRTTIDRGVLVAGLPRAAYGAVGLDGNGSLLTGTAGQ